MRNSTLRNGLLCIFAITTFAASAQNVAVNTSGNSAYTGAILDLSNHNTAGTNGLLPPYVSLSNTATQLTPPITGGTSSQLSGLIVYNTSANLSGPGLYYWYYNTTTPANSAWIYIGNGTVGGTGTLNYLARWTPNGTTLGTGVSQDNGTTAAISTVAAAPVATQMLTVVGNATAINAVIGTTAFTGGAAVKGSVANAGASGGFGVEGLISGAGGGQQYSLYGSSTVTAGNGYGVYGQSIGAAAINYGGYFTASGGTANYGVVVPPTGGFAGFGTITPVSRLDDAGSFGTGTIDMAPAANSTTVLTNDYSTIIATPTAAATVYTLQLPSAAIDIRRIYTIVYNGSGLGTINITSAAGAIEENGSAITPLALTTGSVRVQSDGTKWNVTTLSAGGTLTAANNGLSLSGTTVQLGTSPLLYNTTLPLNAFTLTETSNVLGISHTVQNSTANGFALSGQNTAGSGNSTGIGVYGTTIQSGGYGIEGTNTNLFGGTGIYGTGVTYGVEGVASTSIGVYGSGSTGVTGNGTAFGVSGIGPIAMYGDANNSSGSMGGKFANNGGGTYAYAAYYDGTSYYGINSNSELYTTSNLVALAGKACIVEDKKGDTKLMYCPEAPEILFQDYGTSNLVNGRIHINLDTTYALSVTINEKHPLRVIITMNDECPNNVYVTNRTATGFDVVEMNLGTSNASFTYEIIANRADIKAESWHPAKAFADVRYQPFTIPKQPKNQDSKK